MATQEPNVYAGLAVVIGGLIHARPQFFEKVMGELLFWVGEDKMTVRLGLRDLGAQVAGRGLRRLGDARRWSSSTTRGSTRRQAKILGLNAAKLYGVDVPAELQVPAAADPAAAVTAWGSRVTLRDQGVGGPAHGQRPRARRATRRRSASWTPVSGRGSGVDGRLRLPTLQCAPNFAYLMAADARARRAPAARGAEVRVVLEDHYTGAEINAAIAPRPRVRRGVPRRDRREDARRAAGAVPAQGAARPPGAALPAAARRWLDTERRGAARRATCRPRRTPCASRRCARRSACPTTPTRRRLSPATGRR